MGVLTKERWRQEKVLQEEHDAKVKLAEKARGRAVLEYNNARQMKRAEDAKLEMQNDLVLLQVAQEKEMTKQFQEHLRLQMIKEAEDDTLLEELRRQDEDRVHKKKEAQYQKEQAARANLLKLTVKGRQEQLALKAKWKADELAQDKLRIAHTMRENERLEELEKQAAAQQAQARKDNQTAVTFQIRKKAETRAREKQSEYLQLRQMQHSEKQYMKRLADMKRF